MKINRLSMKCLSFLIMFFSFIGCVTTSDTTKTEPKRIEHFEIFFCEKYNERPINVTKKFIIKDGERVYVIAKLMDLVPNTKYKFKFEWYRPNEKMEGTKTVIQRVQSANWYTGNWLNLNQKYDYPSGVWSAKIFANDIYLGSNKFLLANNETELEMLEEKYAAELEEPETVEAVIKNDMTTKTSSENKFIESGWALIIGISKYKPSSKNGLPNLIFADDDAKAFTRTLRNLGWDESHIKLLTNEDATQRNVMIALESWLTKAGPNDQIILFWAGHGFPDPEDPEKVYFACYDTDIKIPATGYRMDKVRTALEEHEAKNVVIFVDTCHAGKLITRGDRGISIVPNIKKMVREKNIPKGWIFMVGADTDRQAIEHTSWANGAFTHSLIKGISGEADGFQSAGVKDGVVTMGELKDYINTTMPDDTQRVLGVAKRPVITTSTGDPDIWNLTLQAE